MSKKYLVPCTIVTCILFLIGIFIIIRINSNLFYSSKYIKLLPIILKQNKPINTEITISFVGDCTLGSDDTFPYTNSFNQVFDNNNRDYSYFFKGVYEILNNDDLSVANLETTFTTATKKADKRFRFKGDPKYVNILKEGSIEVVNLANNHTYDYLEQGYNETIDTLKNNQIDYYGRDIILIKKIKDIKVGFAGFTFSDKENKYERIDNAIRYFNDNEVNIKIITFHWGVELDYQFNTEEEVLGRYAIDKGFHLVVGHHPHVLQGLEKYNNTNIVYSLGNFVFGGNNNPNDKDSLIYQHTFTFENKNLIDSYYKIIPVTITSSKNINNYQPTIVSGSEKERIIKKIIKYSKDIEYIFS